MMEVNFNVQGQRRKKLVMLIATYTKQKAEYQYTPTYAYQIGKYKVDQHGTLSSPDEIPDSLLEYLTNLGFTTTKTIQLNASYPRDVFTEQSLNNLRHLVWAKSQLIKDAFDIKSFTLLLINSMYPLTGLIKSALKTQLLISNLSISWFNMRKIINESCRNHVKKLMKNMPSVASYCILVLLAPSTKSNGKYYYEISKDQLLLRIRRHNHESD